MVLTDRIQWLCVGVCAVRAGRGHVVLSCYLAAVIETYILSLGHARLR
jgi:hypothetical protein